MKTLLTITDVTRMSGTNVCVAGYTPEGQCVRPVLRWGAVQEDWLLDDKQVVVRPFAIIEFDLQKHTPEAPHTEDWIFNPNFRAPRGMMMVQQQRALLTKTAHIAIQDIFGATIHAKPGRYVMSGEGTCSLGTVQPKYIARVEFVSERSSYRILFIDRAEQWWHLTVVDLSFRQFARYLTVVKGVAPDEVAEDLTSSLRKRYVFLRIGLSRGWKEYPDRCFLQITGVYSFPDYLEGRCFADFRLSE